MDAAQRLAEDAAKRLAEVEDRLAKLDSEIAAIGARAEMGMHYEEQLLNARTAEEIHRIMENSQSEIDRAAQRARSELKAFVGGLAVSLARKSIQIDKRTDQELVKGFVSGFQKSNEFAQMTTQPSVQSDRELVRRI